MLKWKSMEWDAETSREDSNSFPMHNQALVPHQPRQEHLTLPAPVRIDPPHDSFRRAAVTNYYHLSNLNNTPLLTHWRLKDPYQRVSGVDSLSEPWGTVCSRRSHSFWCCAGSLGPYLMSESITLISAFISTGCPCGCICVEISPCCKDSSHTGLGALLPN